jgi:hypothetical protein
MYYIVSRNFSSQAPCQRHHRQSDTPDVQSHLIMTTGIMSEAGAPLSSKNEESASYDELAELSPYSRRFCL